MDASSKNVELGFLEKIDAADHYSLFSCFFRSKVGGRPPWLALKCLPHNQRLVCSTCGQMCVFLLQIYCPIDGKANCFHRSLYIFCCKNPQCYEGNNSGVIKVMRSQLPRQNPFYECEPLEESENCDYSSLPSADMYQKLCNVCGCNGNKRCAKCKTTHYCSKEHQTLDWRSGHKVLCGAPDSTATVTNNFLFCEYEIITEPEEYTPKLGKTEAERMAEYEKFMTENKPSLNSDANDISTDLARMATGENTEDETFQIFKERISHEPEQVLRYDRQGSPLLVSDENKPEVNDIPNCGCGSKRIFEFQVLPQLLNHLDVTTLGQSIDWGTLLVYTCAESCEPPDGQAYVDEFVWKQDFSIINNAK